MERELCFTPFHFARQLSLFVRHGLANRVVQPRVPEVVQRMRQRRCQPALHFVQALRAGFEVGPTVLNAGFDGCVVAQFEVQRLELRSTPPVGPIR